MLQSDKIILYSNYPLFNIFKNKVKKLFKTNLCKINKIYFYSENEITLIYENNDTLYNIINYLGYYQDVLEFSKKQEVGITLLPFVEGHGLKFYSNHTELLKEIYEELMKAY